jgi:hypothetical protein
MPIWSVRFHGEFGGGGDVPRTSRNGEHDPDQILDLSRASQQLPRFRKFRPAAGT